MYRNYRYSLINIVLSMKKFIIGLIAAVIFVPQLSSANSLVANYQGEVQSIQQSQKKCVVLTRALLRGSSNQEVSALQQFLIDEGFSTSVTGYYGPQTEAAVRMYQQKNGISTTGTVGPLTRLYIKNRCGGTIGQCANGALFNNMTGVRCQVPTQATVTVTSPNGREIWTKGTTQNITWNSYFPYPTFAAVGHTISLVPKSLCPVGNVCGVLTIKPYTIGENVTGGIYPWNVGGDKEGRTIPAGDYSVQVCQQGGSVCDSSNATFTIKDVTTALSINAINPTSGKIGSTVTITGSGFTSDSAVYFNNMWKIPSTVNGNTISFVVPSTLTVSCNSNEMCPALAGMVTPNTTYSVKVQTGNVSSNTVSFLVTADTSFNADIDRNGIVNNLDVAILTTNFGRSSSQGIIADADIDLNDDNIIGAEDFNIVASNIGKTPSTTVKGDINKDGAITDMDAGYVQKNFGRAVLSTITFAQVDLNNNGYIDAGDYNIIATKIGELVQTNH
jgi:peptidoglycan hydrolase-like protein with peptidoglycan-binding domain